MFQIIEYIKFLFKSTNQHGVHSPFVYNLVTKCFYDKTTYEAYTKLENYRAALLNNKQSVSITDFGSGSRVFNSNKRVISSMTKASGTRPKRAKLLYRLVRYFKPQHTLELGTSLGIATQAMALGHNQNKVISVEGCPTLSEISKQALDNAGVSNVHIKTGEFNTIIPELKNTKFDIIFFDGNHNKDATLNYFNELIETAHNDSIFIFDDIHWSKGMVEAWNIIQNHPKVTVTIDTFFWGFVCFRKEQAKENFIIRL